MSPEERAAKRQACIDALAAKGGYTTERAEHIIDTVAQALFARGKAFAPTETDEHEEQG